MQHSQIELRDLRLATHIGTYGPGDVVPDAHLLDLTLTLAPALVLIETDAMDQVFDYNPLIRQIDALAQDQPYETQERLMTRIVQACAAYLEVLGVEVALRKGPVLGTTGTLGLRLTLDAAGLAEMRSRPS